MPVTIKDIAEFAGVSRGTVDRALNNREGINPDVARRIRKIAAEMGYTPNRAGKALASRKNPVRIGVILNSLGNPFYEEILTGIEAARREYRDFSAELYLRQLKGYQMEEQLAQIDQMQQMGVNAIVLTPINDIRIRDRINQLTAEKLPVIKLNSDLEGTDKATYIGCNYQTSGTTAAGLMGLISNGSATVGIVTGSRKMLGHSQRIHGFIETCKQDFPNMKIVAIAENNDDEQLSYQKTQELLQNASINAIYFSAGGVVGGCRAIDDLHLKNRPIIICCDASKEIRRLLQENKIHATVCQQPFQQGYQSIKTIFNSLITGELPAQKEIFVENEVKIKYNLT